MTETVLIEPRFNGFPRMAHGGYVSGVVAGLVGEPSIVALRASPPMGRPVLVRRAAGGVVSLVDEERVLVKASPGETDPAAPPPPSLGEAERAAKRFPSERSPSPTCLCCGHLRAEGEGLRIFPGPIAERGVVAAPWVPHARFADGDGSVRPEFLWAALDCPGAWALRHRYDDAGRRLTARMAARLLGSVAVGEPHVVVGWPIARRRRLLECGSGLFGPDGTIKAVARATWMQTPKR